MVEKAKGINWHSLKASLLRPVLLLLLIVVAGLVCIGVIVTLVPNSSKQNVYSSSELIAGVVALAAMVFNLSKLYDAAKADKKEFFGIYMLFTSATAFFTLFLFVYPAYANMTDPHGACWIPLLTTAIALVAACLLLVAGIGYLLWFMWSQFRDLRMIPQPPVLTTRENEDQGPGGSGVMSKADEQDRQFGFGLRLVLIGVGFTILVSGVTTLMNVYGTSKCLVWLLTALGAIVVLLGIFVCKGRKHG